MSLLSFEQVSKSFGGDGRGFVLDQVDFSLEEGQFVAIMGPSGQGKSTLLALAAGLLAPDSGKVLFQGESIYDFSDKRMDAYRAKEVCLIFQKPKVISALTAYENVFFALRGRGFTDASRRAMEALERYGLMEVAEHLPSQLSFGQVRRLAFARSLALEPAILLADEPTNDLDERWCEQVMTDLQDFAEKDGHGVIMVTHDTRYVPRVPLCYELGDGGFRPCK